MKLSINKKYFNLKFFIYGFAVVSIYSVIKSCSKDSVIEVEPIAIVEKDNFKFGYNLNNFEVVNDTVRSGDSFGVLLEKHHLFYPQIHHIAEKTKEVFDVRRLRIGKPYTVLYAKEDTQKPLVFIYQPNTIEYIVVEFCDSIIAYTERKPIKIVEMETSGIIQNTLSETMEDQGLPT